MVALAPTCLRLASLVSAKPQSAAHPGGVGRSAGSFRQPPLQAGVCMVAGPMGTVAPPKLAVQTLDAVVAFLSQLQLGNSMSGALTLFLDGMNLQHGFHSASRASRSQPTNSSRHPREDPVRRQLDFGEGKATPQRMRRNWTLSPKVRPSRMAMNLRWSYDNMDQHRAITDLSLLFAMLYSVLECCTFIMHVYFFGQRDRGASFASEFYLFGRSIRSWA